MLLGESNISLAISNISLKALDFFPSNDFLASHDALHGKIEKQDKIFLFSIPYKKKMVSHDNTSR